MSRVGYLGPAGSFSHEAVSVISGVEAVECTSFADILDGVARGELDHGLVPLENALEGTVSAVIDGLVFDHDLFIEQELIIPIELCLLAKPGAALESLREIRSYPHALGQCRAFLHRWGGATATTLSTSQAAREAADSDGTIGAVASPAAGRHFGLIELARDIEDRPGNATKFVLVGRDRVSAPTGHDRTTIVCFQDADRPGSLYGILGRFAARDINLTKLESRPTKEGLGNYCFVIEFDGHVADDVVADCLVDLQAHLTRVKFLGSYPVTGNAAAQRRGDVSEARAAAADWMQRIKNKVQR